MAGNKYLKNVAGTPTEERALDTSTGVADAGKLVALDSNGRLAINMMPTGIGADTRLVITSEALSAGDLVNIWDNGSVFSARKADAATAKKADGFVISSYASGVLAEVYFDGTITGLIALTPGDRFLSATTPGGSVSVANIPTAPGQIQQNVGVATSASELSFQPNVPITLV